MIYYIYALLDPRDGEIKYIGKTYRPRKRLSQHKNDAKRHKMPVSMWVKNLIDNNLKLEMIIIEQVTKETSSEREFFWIKYYIDRGCQLLNIMGSNSDFAKQRRKYFMENGSYPKHRLPLSIEARRKISESKKGKKFTMEHRKHLSESIQAYYDRNKSSS